MYFCIKQSDEEFKSMLSEKDVPQGFHKAPVMQSLRQSNLPASVSFSIFHINSTFFLNPSFIYLRYYIAELDDELLHATSEGSSKIHLNSTKSIDAYSICLNRVNAVAVTLLQQRVSWSSSAAPPPTNSSS